MIGPRRLAFAGIIGGGGVALMLTLGFWQLDRRDEKRAQIADIVAGLAADPVAVTGAETAEAHAFRAATARGAFDPGAEVARYLTTVRPHGPGFRLISPFTLESGARILVDRGYAPEAEAPRGGAAPPPPPGPQRLVGALRWPRERSSFTPDPNREDGLWFARDAARLAEAFETAPVLLVLTERPTGQTTRWPAPLPIQVDLPNKHLSYAVTWFALAAIWAAMTAALLLRGGGAPPPRGTAPRAKVSGPTPASQEPAPHA